MLEYKKNVKLVEFEERLYDTVVVAIPFLEDPKDQLHPASLVDYVNRGGNVLLFVDGTISDHWREFATEFGVYFEDPDSAVLDHVASVDGNAAVVRASVPADSRVLSSARGKTVAYRGIGHSVEKTNPLLWSVLSAPATSYSGQVNDKPKAGTLSGSDVSLISVLQARNNARVAFVGSLDLFNGK